MTSVAEPLDPSNVEPLNLEKSRAERELKKRLVDFTNTKYREIRSARDRQERQWYINLAFYNGKHYVVPLRPGMAGTRLHVPPAPYYRSRPVHNRIRSIVRTQLAQLTNNKPNATVIPASAEDRDMYAAMAGEQIWESEYRDKKLKKVIREAVWWSCVTGTGYIKTVWDSHVHTQYGPGDIVYTTETPFHVLVPNMRETEIENQPFLIHSTTHPREIILNKFGSQALQSATKNNGNEIMEQSYLGLQDDDATKQNEILMHEVWIKPGYMPELKEGAFLTVIGDMIVQAYAGWPFKHGMYPFAKIDGIPTGKYYSASIIEDLIPIQKEYNRKHAQLNEAANRTAKPKMMGPKGSVDASKVTSEPGQFIPYNPGLGKPEWLVPPPLPSYVLNEIELLLADMSDLAGQHEVTQGRVPPGVTAATAISYLQERDESKLTPEFDSLEEAVEKTARLALNYVKDFWTDERVVKVTGPDGSFDAMALKGSSLEGNTDIRIESGSSLPNSKAAKQALLMDLMKMGFVPPEKGLEVMDMGGINKIYEQLQQDTRQAQRENLRMSKITEEDIAKWQQLQMQQEPLQMAAPPNPTPIIPVNTWDNHPEHLRVHNNYRKGQAFEMLPEVIKEQFELHCRAHIAAMGAELITNNPAIAAGIPPELVPMLQQGGSPMPEGEQQPENQEQRPPGPMPGPQLEGEQ